MKLLAYRYFQHDTKGFAGDGTYSIEGDTWTTHWRQEAEGTKYQCRTVIQFASGGGKYDYRMEYSEDGTTWKPWLTGNAKRVGNVK